MLLATAQQMREADRATIEDLKLPGIVLMENAAQGAARVFWDNFHGLVAPDVAAFCGRGNNGGDGFAILRILANRGYCATAYLFAKKEQVTGDAAVNLHHAEAVGVEVIEVPDDAAFERWQGAMAGHEAYLDALLGTGLNQPVSGRLARAIDLLNDLDAPVLAVDIPSGLSADTGAPLGCAVMATATATFGLLKLGLALENGQYTGEVHLVDICIPPRVVGVLGITAQMAEPDEVTDLLPVRFPGAHKGDFGRVMVAGGSPGMSGAAILAARGALASGAGLVYAALPAGLNLAVECALPAALSIPLAQTAGGALAKEAAGHVVKLMQSRDVLVLGPGLGPDPESRAAAREVLAGVEKPLVLDADGLNALAEAGEGFAVASDDWLITPHPGEAARLLGASIDDIQADRAGAALRLAQKYGCACLLKGAKSVIASPDGELWVNPTGNPLLATGGSGDVLAGLIGGLMAQGLPASAAAVCGAYVHGLAADIALHDFGPRGLAADQLVGFLPQAFAALEGGGEEEHEH